MVKLMNQLDKDLAKSYFFHYCYITASDFYKPERKFLVDLCDELQNFLSDDEHDVLVVNEPPRHGKSRTGGKFVEWILGNDKTKKVMTGSYNETLSTVFSKNVRNTIQEIKADEDRAVFTDIFEGVNIKQGDGAMNLWSLDGGYNNYLATSPTGTATGFGADYIIVDDLIKNAEEANNAMVLDKHWEWFVNTMLSRLETGGKIIVIMTRWHSNDLAGRVLKEMPESGYRVKHVSVKAYDKEKDEMLCEEILSKVEYKRKVKTMGADIASANYQQEPIDIKGRLYQELKTYDSPKEYVKVWNYTDTADRGKDYLASIVFGETKEGQADVIDVLYTKDDMSVTESALASMLIRNNVNEAMIEGNNGGVGFKRSVERICKEKRNHKSTVFKDFHQSANKESRILSNSSWVEENVFFPSDWKIRWPEFYEAITTYQKEGKNKHDDAPDALTGVSELINKKIKQKATITKRPGWLR